MLSQKVAGNAKYKEVHTRIIKAINKWNMHTFLTKKANRGDVYPSPTGTSGSIHGDKVETHTNVTL